MEIVIEDYKISPYKGNTCWQIQKKGASKDGEYWMAAYYYPDSLVRAFQMTFDLILKDNPEKLKDYKKAFKSIKSTMEMFNKDLEDQAARFDAR